MQSFARLGLVVLWLLLVLPIAAQAQSMQSAIAAVDASPAITSAFASPADTRITEYRLPPDKLKKAEALYRTRLIMYVVGAFYGIAVLAVVLLLGVGAKFRDWAEKASPRRIVQALVFAPLLFISMDVLGLPLSVYGEHLQQSYGLSVQSWSSWFWDWIKGELVGTAIATLTIWGLYAILRRSPKRWWFYGWLASIPVVLLLVLIQPMFIDPLFNHFDSLEVKQPRLVPELEKVMHRGGITIARSRMFEMRASDKVTTYNAYVTGIGASKRVVVWDNTSKNMTIPETLFVFGHEQGHYVLNHNWIWIAFRIAGFLPALYVGYRLIGGVLARWGQRWGVRELSDWASLPVLLLMLSVFSFLYQPVSAGFSRYLEHQADIYGLEAIRDLVPDSPQVAASAFQKLGEKGLSYPYPNPVYVAWRYDHPPTADRIRFAAEYQPWNDNQPTRYVK